MKRRKNTEVCCVCGNPFSSHYDGKPYCNKHYLRMRTHGTPDLVPHIRNKNQYEIDGNIVKITVSSGEILIADATDADKLKQHSWCVSKTGYPVSNINGKVTKLHRYLLDLTDSNTIVDHINGNRLDNRQENLRICTQGENSRNLKLSKSNRSGYTGISKTENGRYRVRIMLNRKEISHRCDTLGEAIELRKKLEEIYHGEFAASTSRKGGNYVYNNGRT